MTDSHVTPGTPVPWWRLNGWIAQAGGPDWMRYTLHVLGVCLLVTPWVYIGDLSKDPRSIEPPWGVRP